MNIYFFSVVSLVYNVQFFFHSFSLYTGHAGDMCVCMCVQVRTAYMAIASKGFLHGVFCPLRALP